MVEIHAHLLPGLDDGPRDLEESLALLSAFAADGVTHVVATPHVYSGVFANTRSSIEQALSDFRQHLAQRERDFSLSVAGEVRMDEHVPALYDQGELPFLGQSDGFHNLLLEMPDTHIPLGADKLISWLMARGVRPVIAHPERNRAIREKPALALQMREQGCLMQVSAGALVGGFGPRVQKTAEDLLALEAIDVLASDAHNTGLRSPCMGAAHAALAATRDQAFADALTRDNPARLCGLEPMGVPPVVGR